MKIDYDGRTWKFDVEDIPVGQCEAVEKYVPAKGMGDWSNKVDAGNTKAVIALWWLMRKQAGEEPGPISQPGDSFLPVKLLFAFNAAQLAEVQAAVEAAEAAEAEPDPTRTSPALSSPGPAGTTTMTGGPAAAAAPSPPG